MTIVSKPSELAVVACGANKFSSHSTVTVLVSEVNEKDTQQSAA